MTTALMEVYDALREAGASEERSRAAAEALAAKSDLRELELRLTTTFTIRMGVVGVPRQRSSLS